MRSVSLYLAALDSSELCLPIATQWKVLYTLVISIHVSLPKSTHNPPILERLPVSREMDSRNHEMLAASGCQDNKTGSEVLPLRGQSSTIRNQGRCKQ